MDKNRKKARDQLCQSTRSEYEQMIYNAKLTTTQEKMLNWKYLDGMSHMQISEKLVGRNEDWVIKEFTKIYDKVTKAIKEGTSNGNVQG